MKIIKRNGSEVVFNVTKIINAIAKANNTVPEPNQLTREQILKISEDVERHCKELGRAAGVEEIQDAVEKGIMAAGAFDVAKNYITSVHQNVGS